MLLLILFIEREVKIQRGYITVDSTMAVSQNNSCTWQYKCLIEMILLHNCSVNNEDKLFSTVRFCNTLALLGKEVKDEIIQISSVYKCQAIFFGKYHRSATCSVYEQYYRIVTLSFVTKALKDPPLKGQVA